MNLQEQTLWSKIQQFNLDDAEAVFTFSRRLMRENGWGEEYALRVIEEYKKFMFLLCVCPHPVTPSDPIDQVWHLHLLYTQSYWEEFCDKVLERKVHHGPTKGGNQERKKYINLYELTQKAYQAYFEKTPPTDIWWEGERRFKEINFRRINLDRNWVLPKPNWAKARIYLLGGIFTFLGLIWSCTTPKSQEMATLISKFWLFAIFLIILLIAFYTTPHNSKNKKNNTKPGYSKKVKKKKASPKNSSSTDTGTVVSDGSVSGCSSVSDSSTSSDSGCSSFGGGDSGGGGGDSSGCSGCSGCGGGCGGGD